MLRWLIVVGGTALFAAMFGFLGDFTLLKGAAQLAAYVLLVVFLVLLVAAFFRGTMK